MSGWSFGTELRSCCEACFRERSCFFMVGLERERKPQHITRTFGASLLCVSSCCHKRNVWIGEQPQRLMKCRECLSGFADREENLAFLIEGAYIWEQQSAATIHRQRIVCTYICGVKAVDEAPLGEMTSRTCVDVE